MVTQQPTRNGAGPQDELASRLRLHRHALELAPKLGYRYAEALAHEGIASVLDQTDARTAAEHRKAAQSIHQSLST
jgi:hypothetical protein